MRHHNSTRNAYGAILIRYYKAIRRKNNLVQMNRNKRRQGILTRRIEQLRDKLLGFQYAFKKSIAASLVIGAAMFTAPEANAQISFGSMQVNPFGITSLPAGYYGNQSSPAFVDLDGDGDMDMLSTEGYGNYFYYENTGSASSPSYAAKVQNPFGLTAPQHNPQHPTFADLDGDGDFDLLVGKRGFQRTASRFYYYENTGTATSPSFAAVQNNPFNLNPPSSSNNAPTFVDIDNDGDYDMSSPHGFGHWIYYENVGTASAPNYSNPVIDPFSLVQVAGSWYFPGVNYHSYGDLDGDGDLDIMTGSTWDGFAYLENVGTASSPSFAAPQIGPFNLTKLWRSTAHLVDMDNDGKMDLMAGTGYGNFHFFPNTSGSAKQSNIGPEAPVLSVTAFPNPIVDQLQLELVSVDPTQARVRILDVTGKTLGNESVFPLTSGKNLIKIDASQLASGTYFVHITTEKGQFHTKFVK